jgi:hypothetical protein
MFATCRATVFSLRKRSPAIDRLVLPAATRRSTSTSRAVRPPAATVALDEQHVPAGTGSDGMQQGSAEAGGDLRQLVRGGAGLGSVATGERDLDVRREHPCPARSIMCLTQHAADRGMRVVDATLGHAQQRQPGLRLLSVLGRLTVGLLGLAQRAAEPVHVAEGVEGHAGGRPPAEPFACSHRFVQRGRPLAAQLHDLGPVYQALAAVRHQARLRLTPSGQGRRPFLGPLLVEDLLTGQDGGAVRDADVDRGHLARRDRDHDLVEKGQPVGGLAQRDQSLALAEPGHGHGIRVAEAVGHLGEPAEPVVRERRLAGHETAQGVGHEQKAARDAVEPGFVQQALGPREPAAGARHLAGVHEAHAQVKAAERRAVHVARVSVCAIAAGPGISALVVLAGQVGGDGEPFEVRWAESAVVVGGGQVGVRGSPGPARKRLPAVLQRFSRRHVVTPAPRRGPATPVTRGTPPGISLGPDPGPDHARGVLRRGSAFAAPVRSSGRPRFFRGSP